MLTQSDPSGPLHTPEEMRFISDLAHWIEGGVLLFAAALAFWGACRAVSSPRIGITHYRESTSWAIVLLGAGVILSFYLVFPHHGIAQAREQWEFVFGDAQQRQHVIIALLLIAGAAAEVWYRTRDGLPRAIAYLWPASAASIGLLFAVHTQHGTTEAVARAVFIHRALASLFVGAALLRAMQVLTRADVSHRPPYGWLGVAWPGLLLMASVFLLSYREPAGAFASTHSTATMLPHSR